MTRGLCRSLFTIAVVASLIAPAGASGPVAAGGDILQRFLALDDPTPTQCRALRHLEARNAKFEKSAWMDVWTDGDPSGFRYQIVAEEGSEYIRSRVFRASLDTERALWAAGTPDAAALTLENYVFEDRGALQDGLASLRVKARRHGVLFVDGSIYLNPDDGELVRMEGQLTKTPSFWTRRVQIVRWYRRIAGFRMPTALESVASVRIAGISTFRVSYEYESINGQRVGSPQPRTPVRTTTR